MDYRIEETITVGVAELRRCSDGVLEIRILPGARIGGDEIDELLVAQLRLMPVRTAVLCDTRSIVSMTREAWERSAASPVTERTAANALVVGGPVSSVLVDVLIRLGRPPYPTRAFREAGPARAWLLEQLAVDA